MPGRPITYTLRQCAPVHPRVCDNLLALFNALDYLYTSALYRRRGQGDEDNDKQEKEERQQYEEEYQEQEEEEKEEDCHTESNVRTIITNNEMLQTRNSLSLV